MSKNNLIIFVALAAVLSLMLVMDDTKDTGGPGSHAQQTLVKLDLDALTQIVLKTQGQSFALMKQGEQWVHEGFPASIAQINQLLIQTMSIKTRYKVASDVQTFESLGLTDETCSHIEFSGSNGLMDVLKIGKDASTKGMGQSTGTYVTSQSTPVAYIAGTVPQVSMDKSSWLKTEIYQVAGDQLDRIEFVNGSTPLMIQVNDFEKQDYEVSGFDAEKYKVKEWAVKSAVRDLAKLNWSEDVLKRSDDTLSGKEFGEYARVILKDKTTLILSGLEISGKFYLSVTVAPASDDGKLNPLWQDRQAFFDTWVFVLDSWVAGKVKGKQEDLLEAKTKPAEDENQSLNMTPGEESLSLVETADPVEVNENVPLEHDSDEPDAAEESEVSAELVA